jgi:hypothetical protein
MMRLDALGWGAKRLAKEFGSAQHGSAVPSSRWRDAVQKACAQIGFEGLDDWLRERSFRHSGNADLVRQELASSALGLLASAAEAFEILK